MITDNNTNDDSKESSGFVIKQSQPLSGGEKGITGGLTDLPVIPLSYNYKVNWLNLPGGKVIIENIEVFMVKKGEILGKTTLMINEVIHGHKYINDFARCRIKRWNSYAIITDG
jgi:hypothetical protein